jgi:hypothetical protein
MRAKRVMEPFTTDGIAMGFFTRHTKDMSNKLFIHSRINLKKLFPAILGNRNRKNNEFEYNIVIILCGFLYLVNNQRIFLIVNRNLQVATT